MEGVAQFVSILMQDWIYVFTFIVGAVLALYIYTTKNFGYFKSIGLSNPKPYPFVGTMHILFSPTGAREGMMELVKKHGKVFGMFKGGSPQFFVAEESFLKEILVKKFSSYADHSKLSFGNKYVDQTLPMLTGDEWKRVRKELIPTFTSSRLKEMMADIREVSQEFVDHVTSLIGDESKITINVKEPSSNFTMGVIARAMFGIVLESFKETDNEFVKNAKEIFPSESFGFRTVKIMFNCVFPSIMKSLEVFGITAFPKQCADFFCGIVDNLLSSRESQIASRKDFLAVMVKAHKAREDQESNKENNESVNKRGLDRADIIAAGFISFMGGYTTISSSFAVCIYHIADNRDWQQKVYDEIECALSKSNGDINADILAELPTLDMCIKESLRISPPQPLMDRVATADNVVNGISIAKGTTLWIPVHAIHHCAEYYPDPEKFDPMRFSKENNENRLDHVYLPFGYGPRMCIGSRMSVMLLKVALVHVIRAFDLSVPDEKGTLEFSSFGISKTMVSFKHRTVEN